MENLMGGVIGLAVIVLCLVLSAVWLVLPFIIISKANKMIALLQAANEQLQMLNYKRDKDLRGE